MELHICPSSAQVSGKTSETDKAKYAYLDPLAILRFYTEPPTGIAKVIIIIGIRIVFWIFNTKYLIFCLFCIVVRSVSRLKGGLISKY